MTDCCTLSLTMSSSPGEVTSLLRRVANGDRSAQDELASHVYVELHKLAAHYLRHEPRHIWQTSELVNEAYLKLIEDPDHNFQGRSHFFGVAARIMRRILTDHARRRHAEKRGGNLNLVPFEDGLVISEQRISLIADLDEALQRLEAIDEQAARIVELRFFAGLTEEECAEFLGISSRTVKRLWIAARAWLFGHLKTKSEQGG